MADGLRSKLLNVQLASWTTTTNLSRITTLKKTALYELIKLGELRPDQIGSERRYSSESEEPRHG